MKRTKYIFHLLLALCVGFVPVACGDDDENETGDIGGVVINASLSAPEVTDITYSQATVSATFSGSSVGVLKRGFCSAATDEPTINDSRTTKFLTNNGQALPTMSGPMPMALKTWSIRR